MSDFVPLPSNFEPVQQAQNPVFDSLLNVLTYPVYKILSALNSSKAQGPDSIPTWLLKENADLSANPVSDTLNSSYHESKLPQSWKTADIVPIKGHKTKICDLCY